MFALAAMRVATAAVYFLYRGIQYCPQGLFLSERARAHLFVLLGLLLAVKAGGYLLESFDLVYSSRGAAFGASYTNVYANLPALRILALLSLIAAALHKEVTFLWEWPANFPESLVHPVGRRKKDLCPSSSG